MACYLCGREKHTITVNCNIVSTVVKFRFCAECIERLGLALKQGETEIAVNPTDLLISRFSERKNQ